MASKLFERLLATTQMSVDGQQIKQWRWWFDNHCVTLRQWSNGEYQLSAHNRLLGYLFAPTWFNKAPTRQLNKLLSETE